MEGAERCTALRLCLVSQISPIIRPEKEGRERKGEWEKERGGERERGRGRERDIYNNVQWFYHQKPPSLQKLAKKSSVSSYMYMYSETLTTVTSPMNEGRGRRYLA